MTWEDAVSVEEEGAFPATSRSVLAGANLNAPERGVVDSAEHEPEQEPVTVNVTVRFPLLRDNVPGNDTERVLLLDER
jgi:hypothetical protein